MGAGATSGIRLRRGLLAAAVAGAIVALGGGATWLLSSHHAPAHLGLSTPSPGSSQSALVGTWKVSTGSEAGYRVKEKFINQPATTEAVARTAKVAGGFVVVLSGSRLVVSQIHFTVDLTTLVSQDRYATYQVYQRDFFVRTVYLETNRFPTADFTAASIPVPTPASGAISMGVNGKLNVHGVTKAVLANLQAQLTGDQVELAGSINVDMRDFAIAPPDISFTTAEPQVIIEFHLFLIKD